MTDSNPPRHEGLIFPRLTTPGCATAQPAASIERELSPYELILGSGRGNAMMKMHYAALRMLANGSSLGDKVVMLDPKGGESTETTVGRMLLS